jgi:K(+)-stimulated pyrophosphate-energized sodium pump
MFGPFSPRLVSKSLLSLVGLVGVLLVVLAGSDVRADWPGAGPLADSAGHAWQAWSFFTSPLYSWPERLGVLVALAVAIFGLVMARKTAQEIYAADAGTAQMQRIAQSIRQGADAYLKRQFAVVAVLIVLITAVLIAAKWPWGLAADAPDYAESLQIAIGRGVAFLVGAVFSATVGFAGMRLATTGNLRVAAAARQDFATAFYLAHRTGVVTGLLTTSLGLLGATILFLYYGERAFETLLGFAFGGTLLALFMRVGGGIYTKAADVGADLVGKIEKDIPEDDPRNAATIADNVGDNVGDCAGMAADVFESYMVTLVAAMILGLAAFGTKGVIFPILVQAMGLLVSIYSTYSVRATADGNAATAMRSLSRGFRRGASMCVIGFMGLGLGYLYFDKTEVIRLALERGLAQDLSKYARRSQQPALQPLTPATGNDTAQALAWWDGLSPEMRVSLADQLVPGTGETLFQYAQVYVPLVEGFNIQPAFACLIGLLLVLALSYCTEYWTGTNHAPVQKLAQSCRTGHATNIIEGISLGYESAVWAVLIIAAAIASTLILFTLTGLTSPIFIAYGVALCGIGMLSLTTDILSMDVFGPVADNANGIGEMGYNRNAQNQPLAESDPDYIAPEVYRSARQTLTDLDATGNTTKAITKGVAIGSAVIAAVSLFASFIAVLAKGREDRISELTDREFAAKAATLTIADPLIFVGMLIGAAVPFLFSSMTIRAVGRAAYLIVYECRRQFRDRAIWDGTKQPEYGRVVDICTSTAQKELIGPALLAIFMPMLVGFLMGPAALAGYLAGMIISGQLLAVFMANAGGAWDNAKKTIEDQPRTERTGKGSPAHKAAVTGDTVGDPLKDTAGPAINPLIKVMNMVGLLILPLVLSGNIISGSDTALGWTMTAIAAAMVGFAWWRSGQDSREMKQLQREFDEQDARPASSDQPEQSEALPAVTR